MRGSRRCSEAASPEHLVSDDGIFSRDDVVDVRGEPLQEAGTCHTKTPGGIQSVVVFILTERVLYCIVAIGTQNIDTVLSCVSTAAAMTQISPLGGSIKFCPILFYSILSSSLGRFRVTTAAHL